MKTPDASIEELCPTGVLRVALNFGNRVLVGRDDRGQPCGIAVDLSRALAADLGVELTYVEMDRAVDVSSSACDDIWDVCFLAVDPKRSETIAFSDPYVQIEGCYLAGPRCAAMSADELVASRVPVGSVTGSAYSLTLARQAGADCVRYYEDIHAMLAALDRGDVSAVAGIGSVMAEEATKRPGSRVLMPPFMEIRQGMGVPVGRSRAAELLRSFVRSAARSGRVGDILERHGVSRDCAIVT